MNRIFNTAQGGVDITFSGFGFVEGGDYECVFTANDTDRAATGQTSALTTRLQANATAIALSPTHLSCELPRWEYPQVPCTLKPKT